MNAFGRWSVLSLLVATLSFVPVAHAQATDTTPRITGIAHVAIRVADLAKSRAFYKALGFTEPFNITDKDGNVTEQFVKINDHQYIELYPSDATHAAGFLHVCWEAVNLEGLYPIFTANGVVSPPVRKAGAGNMLMAWKGPEDQTVEITEYMPGSRHSNDFGKDLGADRISDTLLGATMPVPDVQTMVQYFRDKMSFRVDGLPAIMMLAAPPSAHDRYIGFTPSKPASPPSIMMFHVTSVSSAQKALQTRGLNAIETSGVVRTKDPDGNLVEFTTASTPKL
jgi:catechol 2,3-dioxygenase-like lactoylglutathione lyase family enzyme